MFQIGNFQLQENASWEQFGTPGSDPPSLRVGKPAGPKGDAFLKPLCLAEVPAGVSDCAGTGFRSSFNLPTLKQARFGQVGYWAERPYKIRTIYFIHGKPRFRTKKF